MQEHLSVPRLLALAEDVAPETEELKHLAECPSCFSLLTAFIRDRRNERATGTTGTS